MVKVSLTARPTSRAGAKAGHSDPTVESGIAEAQRIKATLGITGLSLPRVHIDGEVWHLDVGSTKGRTRGNTRQIIWLITEKPYCWKNPEAGATPWEVEKFFSLAKLKKQMSLTAFQHQVLIGTLLGDGHLERNGRHVRLKIDHAVAQKEYVWWKYHAFQSHAAAPPKTVQFTDRRNGATRNHCRFATRSLIDFDEYHALFYFDRMKIIPQTVRDEGLTPLMLAVWYMDDGARRTDCRALRLHTNGYRLEEQEVLVEMLRVSFAVEAKVHRVRGDQYTLYIPSGQAVEFCRLVEPFVLPQFRYKLL